MEEYKIPIEVDESIYITTQRRTYWDFSKFLNKDEHTSNSIFTDIQITPELTNILNSSDIFQNVIENINQELQSPIRHGCIVKNTKTCKRTHFNRTQKMILENYFECCKLPSVADKMYLAKTCSLNMKQVDNWFSNKRKRQHREVES